MSKNLDNKSKNKADDKRSLAEYSDLFAKIKVNKSKDRGEAPYKPILLLSVIDLIAQGHIKDELIYISDKLIERFNIYWEIINPDFFNGGLALPFFHLKNDGFWKLKYSDSYDGGRPQTIPKLKEDVDYAKIDRELFELLQDSYSRQELMDTLIEAWFSSSQKEIEEILKVNQNLQTAIDAQDIAELEKLDNELKFYFKKSVVRNAFFRKAIVHVYDYQCSLCGLKVIQSLTQSIVDGAHIKPFAQFYDNRVDNGISLCKNHHWAFDRGLFSINNDYKIVVAKNFQEKSPNSRPLRDFDGESILLPQSQKDYPRLEAIQWHKKNVFRA
jgi:putative restriction endonuclease